MGTMKKLNALITAVNLNGRIVWILLEIESPKLYAA